MPTTDLVAAPAAPLVTTDDLDLIKRTIANGATDAELKLFLFDCKRRGVHPLDKLIHFTKRSGKYTPVTSIDFMRAQAAMTGEMAGSDDATFDEDPVDNGPPIAATVTVHRLTQGRRYAYTATARWAEYKPEQNDFMWRKMPRTMLSKCAEALALRKAFPQQLAGLYAEEELEQPDPAPPAPTPPKAPPVVEPPHEPEPPEDARDHPEEPIHIDPRRVAQLPPGCVFITAFTPTPTRNKNVVRYMLTVQGGPTWPRDQGIVSTFSTRLADEAETAWQTETPVQITTKKTKYGYDLVTLEPAARELPLTQSSDRGGHDAGPPLTADDIPFR